MPLVPTAVSLLEALRKPVSLRFAIIAHHPRYPAVVETCQLLVERDDPHGAVLRRFAVQLPVQSRQFMPGRGGACMMRVVVAKIEGDEVQPWMRNRNRIAECMQMLIRPIATMFYRWMSSPPDRTTS